LFGSTQRLVSRVALALAVIAASAVPARAQSIVAGPSSSAVGVGSAIVFDYTTPAGVDQFLVVAVAVRSSSVTVGAVSFAGVALTPIVSESAGGYCRSELWGLIAPPAGTGTVAVMLSAASSTAIAAAVSYAGIDGKSPVASSASTHGTRGAVSVALTSASTETVVDSVCGAGASAPSGSPAPGQIQRWNASSGNLLAAGSDRPGAPAVTMQWTLTQPAALGWATAAAALRPAAPRGATPDASTPAADGATADVRLRDDGPAAAGDGARATEPDAGSPPPPEGGTASLDAFTGAGGDAPPPALAPGDGRSLDGAIEALQGPPVIHLRVGCSCRAGGPARGGGWLAILPPLAACRLRRRWWQRRSPGRCSGYPIGRCG
jgi:hypothetical protein